MYLDKRNDYPGHFTVNDQPYSWGKVPFIPFKNNDFELPDLQFVKTLVDNYDLTRSDIANELEDIKNVIYALKGYGGESLSEFMKDLAYYRAVKLDADEDAGLDKIETTIDIEAAEKHYQQLKKDIFDFGQGVDKNSDKLGNSPSGIALKFIYSGLDLKENDIKATFFLIGNQIDGLEDTVKRIFTDGHSIGLHTYTHKFKRIYSNRNTFINEMIQSSDKINEVVGISPDIIRFPGGSRGHLSESFLDKLHSYNFRIYDWNMETVDGLNPKVSPYKLYRQATKDSEELHTIILLLHCDYMHKNTCKALPEIIKYYKNKGYEFKPITEETPELYFPISKKAKRN